ncbi:fumarylacetoacetate hydrolase family protein [Microbacterium soli]|uniref:Fumarylacetoacetate hydrolase family protein n=1 Tax=Microbacterium soli TaxID=446075 RepID=A0ABP7MVK7_9MICO
MRIALYSLEGEKPRLGVVTERGCVDLADLGIRVRTFAGFWEAWPAISGDVRSRLDGAPYHDVEDVEWHLPVDADATFWAAAANYSEHLAEGSFARPDFPPFFIRSASSLVPHGGSVHKPWFSDRLDYEGELAIIIGARARHVSEQDALKHVAGYTCFNDGSVRDWQRHTNQITVGKNFFASGALGPWITTADDVGDIDGRMLRTAVNDRVVQSSAVGEAIWGVRYVVSYLSAVTVLRPGDVIALGTPGGVGARQTPPLFLRAGDRVEITIEGVGTLAHGVTEPVATSAPWPAGVTRS